MNDQIKCDFLVVGGGIAGASAAAALAPHGRTVLIEQETSCGYHATGRSAAVFAESYGNAAVRLLTVASGPFFRAPPAGFAEASLVRDRGALLIATEEQTGRLATSFAEMRELAPNVRLETGAFARERVSILSSNVCACIYDPDAADVDVDLLINGFLRELRKAGGRVMTECGLRTGEWRRGRWNVETNSCAIDATVIINAAGAWADGVAGACGVQSVGLTALRRTAILVDAPTSVAIAGWPLVLDCDERFYFKPDAGKLLVSPADETPSAPCDAAAEEEDVALAVWRFEEMTTHSIQHVRRRWAGLRTFAATKAPVIGRDDGRQSFFWLAGQGGYGVQTAPAAAALVRTLLVGGGPGRDLPGDLDPSLYDPRRAREAAAHYRAQGIPNPVG